MLAASSTAPKKTHRGRGSDHSAVEGQLGAREPDLWAGRLSFLSAFSHMDSEVSRLLPSQTVTPLSPGRGGARAGRRVCGMSVGQLKKRKAGWRRLMRKGAEWARSGQFPNNSS